MSVMKTTKKLFTKLTFFSFTTVLGKFFICDDFFKNQDILETKLLNGPLLHEKASSEIDAIKLAK